MAFERGKKDKTKKKICRVMKIKLEVTPEQEKFLISSVASFSLAFNFISSFGWEHKTCDPIELHHACYYPVKGNILPHAQLCKAALAKAGEALASAFALKKKRDNQILENQTSPNKYKIGKPISCPSSESQTIRYDLRSYSLNFKNNFASLSTIEGKRVKVGFKVPKAYNAYLSTPWKIGSAELIFKENKKGKFGKNEWFLHISVSQVIDKPKVDTNSKVTGVDLGINVVAVDSNAIIYGNDNWKLIDENYVRVSKELQQKGTKSAKKRRKTRFQRQKRFHKDCNHCLSKSLVKSCNPNDVLVLEDLTDIRQTAKSRLQQRRLLNNWGFAQIREFIEYKAEGKGVKVFIIDPRNTSRTCSACGYCDKGNRKTQANFVCLKCSFTCNADLNAAKNIRMKYFQIMENFEKKKLRKIEEEKLHVNEIIKTREYKMNRRDR